MFCKTTVRITIQLQQNTVSFQSVDHMNQLLQAFLRRPRTTSPTGVLWNMANSTGKKISVIVIFNVNNNNKYTWIQIIFTKWWIMTQWLWRNVHFRYFTITCILPWRNMYPSPFIGIKPNNGFRQVWLKLGKWFLLLPIELQ